MRAVITLIVAIASALPDEIVYIPEGGNLIYPSSHPKGITVKLAAADGEQIAATFNEQLGKLAKGNIKLRLDFKHEADGPTAGYPTGGPQTALALNSRVRPASPPPAHHQPASVD